MKELKIILVVLFVFNLFLIFKLNANSEENVLYFLDVGQGDSTLLISEGIKILTDAGPTKKVSEELGKVMGQKKYIDLAVITHPQLDHFNGFNYLLEEYDFGAFIINGKDVELREWKDLLKELENKKIPILTIGEGDKIQNGDVRIKILSPGRESIRSGELNDTSIVQLVQTKDFKVFLSGDIGFAVEKYLAKKYGEELDVDVLKTAHHGSKYSSDINFLKTISPKAALIGAGDKNRYGHPSKDVVQRLIAAKSEIFRTDQDGNIKVMADGDLLEIYTTKR